VSRRARTDGTGDGREREVPLGTLQGWRTGGVPLGTLQGVAAATLDANQLPCCGTVVVECDANRGIW
jgi:hypothetical protein